MEAKSPGMPTSGRKSAVSGSGRKLKDNAADWHNYILKWEKLNDEGSTIANQIVNLRLSKETGKEADIAVECDSTAVTQPTADLAVPNRELEDRCTALVDILEKMAHLVSKMEKLCSSAEGVCDLEAFQQDRTGVCAPLFHTWTTKCFAKVSAQLLHSYTTELALKRAIVAEMAHSSNPTSAWSTCPAGCTSPTWTTAPDSCWRAYSWRRGTGRCDPPSPLRTPACWSSEPPNTDQPLRPPKCVL
ncbi:hypothetical protein AGOR_G00101920 [Albula goreensis]|uniref:Cyclin-dependent kinase 2-interacting protein n=1 Tax=Albula goreensis TaxID=1534307 RepID=A0A8T3DL48_9TELE|nr:hypothetical protein AGOR_G00101920 [Albula goreensis]